MILGVLNAGLASNRALLEPVLGQPLLARQLERLGRSRKMDALVVVTAADGGGDAVAALCEDLQVPCVRSESVDTLDRVHDAALRFAPGHVACLDGKHSLTDPALIDEVIEEHLEGDHDCTSTSPPLSYPRGTEVSVVRFDCLQEAFVEAQPAQRQAITRFFRAYPHRYETGSVSAESDYSEHRWEVEAPEDLELITRIYAALYHEDPDFSWRNVLELFERNPDWVVAKEGAGRHEDFGVDELAAGEGEISA